jgi:glycosyltransferase involved in cell wall biosynthesis
MRIALDLRRIGNRGIGRYMQCLVEAVLAHKSGHEFLLILPPDAQELISVNGSGAQKISSSLKYYSVREQFELPRILRAQKIDLLHSPHFMMPLWSPCPAVVTIHDVIYLACKEDLPSWAGRLYYRRMMAASTRRAQKIITCSEFSRDDIVRWLQVDPARIEVIYPGVSPVFQPETDQQEIATVLSRYRIALPYILYAGIYKPRKNHAGLLRAFREFLSAGVEAQLVIAGPMDNGEAILKNLAQELGIANHVVLTGPVDDSELKVLYSAARVYACPSLYEGFGFTVLEAMACGAPVVCSPRTSLPEVAGEPAMYADPVDPEKFAEALARVFSDDQLRAELILKGRKHCERFNWARTAAQTIAIYEQAFGATVRKAVYA